MKILFSVGNLELELGASNKIAVTLAEELSRQGHACWVVGCHEGSHSAEKLALGTTLLRFKANSISKVLKKFQLKYASFLSASENSPRNIVSTFLIMLLYPIHKFVILIDRIHSDKILSQRQRKITGPHGYRANVIRLVRKEAIDAVICVQEPLWAEWQLFKKKLPCATYVYQVDPCGLQDYDLPLPKDVRIQLETSIFNKAQHIFTTPILFSQYKTNATYNRFTSKMTAVEFPNIIHHFITEKSAVEFDHSYYNILFCGMVFDGYRSPAFFLEQLSQLIKRGVNVRCYFLGDVISIDVQNALHQMPENIFVVPKVPMEVAFATMAAADVLLNLGNTLENMVPSKIFDYFSLGKPVINIQKIPNCPAAPYISKYPTQLTIKDYEMKNMQRELERFLSNAVKQNVDFNIIEGLYVSATPSFVAKQITAVLKGYHNG